MSQDIEWLLKEKFGGEKSDAFFADCKRLALGEPLGYLIGHVPFLGCTIHLDSKPLIPRTETEFWTEKAIEEIKRAAPSAPRA
jgi:methylase of polypeptide subunit release factors